MDKFVKNEAVIYNDEYMIYNNLIDHEKVVNHYTVNNVDREYANGENSSE